MILLKKRSSYLTGLLALWLTSQPVLAQPTGTAADFEYYLLSLSWSPEFCQARPGDQQCGRGYGLVLHGLWPQYQKGYPESCTTERLDAGLLKEFSGLYPSPKLAFHEWQKHGTCTGLSSRDYLAFSQKLRQQFVAPPELKDLSQPLRITAEQLRRKIVAANPYLNDGSVAFACTGAGRFLQEVYLCLDKSGTKANACSNDVQKRSRRSCGRKDFLIRSIR